MFKYSFILGAALAALPIGAASATDFDKNPGRFNEWRTGASLVEGAARPTPSGMARLCNQRPELCPEYRTRFEVSKVVRTLSRAGSGAAAAPNRQFIDRARLAQLRTVNETVNDMIRPVHDRGPDTWEFSSRYGDCEEYVLMKREVLASLGWSRSAMRIAAAVTRNGENHAVLIIRGEFEDLVLDNLTDDVLGLGATTHRYIAAESSVTPGRWVSVQPRPAPVAHKARPGAASFNQRAAHATRPALTPPSRGDKANGRITRR